ncbi:MAG TPA: TonB-dependent receptor [Rhizomicrobium sp.]|nr:TonB-dependent receptor [Rhizomicrobium sp.]
MQRQLLLCSVMAGAIAFAGSAHAQSGQTIETVIVTGKKTEQDKVPMKATYTQSTISQETILNASPGPTTSIQTLLNTEPSIYATTGGPSGMETDVKFRSFSDGEFGETAEGVPLNDIFNGGVTYQADNRNNNLFITRDLEGVDIYRGVNNPAVNTYNSLGGTVDYRLRQPTDAAGGDIGMDGGSFNTLSYHATLNTGDWNGIKQTVSYERDTSSGWHKYTPDWNNNLYYAGTADVNPDLQLFANFVYNHNRGDAPQDIPVNLLRTFGNSYHWAPDTYRQTNDDENYLGIVGFTWNPTSNITVEDKAYGGNNNYQRVSFSNPAYGGPYYLDDQGTGFPFWTSYGPPSLYNPITVFGDSKAGTSYHFYGYDGKIFGDKLKATADLPFNTVTAGGDFNTGALHSREYWYGAYNMPLTAGYNDAWDEHDSRTMWSVFIQDDIHLLDDRLHITPGLKYISSVSKDNDALGFYYVPPGSLKGKEHFLSPTVGASFEAFPDFTIYGSYGKNVKFPDITSLYNELGYGGAVPPATVKPEYVQDYEAGVRYKMDNLQASLNAYQEDFTDIIYSIPVPGGFGSSEQVNGGGERYRGVELQLTGDFGQVYTGNLNGFLNASYNEAVCTTATSNALTGGSCDKGEGLANIPNYLVNAGLTWDGDGWHIDLNGQYVGKQKLQDWDTGLPEPAALIAPGQPTKNPSYLLFNLGVVKVVPVDFGPANAVRLAVHVDNIFNEHYYSDAVTNSDSSNPYVGGNQLRDVYAIAGAPRAVYGSIGIYF